MLFSFCWEKTFSYHMPITNATKKEEKMHELLFIFCFYFQHFSSKEPYRCETDYPN